MKKAALARGTRDFGPEQLAKRQYIINTIKEVYELYGFQPLETPAIENLSTLTGKYGDEGDQLLFKILNSGDYLKKTDTNMLVQRDFKKIMPVIAEKGLRYDLTVPFARYVVMNRNDLSFPFKRYQIQPVWRADRPQKGRYREFYQCDADVIGSNSLLNEVELIQIIDMVYKKLGLLSNISIKLNNRKILQGIIKVIHTADQSINKSDKIGLEKVFDADDKFTVITVAIDKLDKIGLKGVNAELANRGISEESINQLATFLNFEGNVQETLAFLKEKLADSAIGLKGVEEMSTILQYLDTDKMPIKLDISLARGLSYYTGTILEVVPLGTEMKGSINGGGRYDDLTSVFGLKGVSGVGFSFGLDRIYDVMEELDLFKEITTNKTKALFINFDKECQAYTFPLVTNLRKEGINVEIFPEPAANGKKLKRQMNYANKKNIPYVILTGSTEKESGLFSFKTMETGEQETLTIEAITERLK